MVLSTDAEPLVAHAHGISFLFMLFIAIGKGMPMKKARGAIINDARIIFVIMLRLINEAIILGIKR